MIERFSFLRFRRMFATSLWNFVEHELRVVYVHKTIRHEEHKILLAKVKFDFFLWSLRFRCVRVVTDKHTAARERYHVEHRKELALVRTVGVVGAVDFHHLVIESLRGIGVLETRSQVPGSYS